MMNEVYVLKSTSEQSRGLWTELLFEVCKSQISKISGSFRYHKSTNFLVRKFANLYYLSANCKHPTFYKILPDSVSKQFLKSSLFLMFYNVQLIRSLGALFVRGKGMQLRTCGSVKSANHKKMGSAKAQICNLSHLRKVLKPNILFRSANLRILQFLELICGLLTFGDYMTYLVLLKEVSVKGRLKNCDSVTCT